MKTLQTIVAVVLIVGFTSLGVSNIVATQRGLQLQKVELKDTNADLLELQNRYDGLLQQLDEAAGNEERIKQLEQEKKQLDEERQRLERELSAKREAQRIAQERTQQAANLSGGTAYAAGGNKDTWLAASGIPSDQWWAVDYIVSRESSWNPKAVNPSSGACGLGQQLPCGKWAGAWDDPVAALKAQYQYVTQRYGGYPQAVAFWRANHWY